MPAKDDLGVRMKDDFAFCVNITVKSAQK